MSGAIPPTKNLKFHEYANLFPLMGEDELNVIVEDMKQNGYDKSAPIILYQNKILDGRNRYNAAKLAGVTPVYTKFDGAKPLEFVIRHNLKRRHLNESQRAVIASKLANMGRADTLKQNRSANLLNGKTSQEDSAKMFNVSTRLVTSVKAIEKSAPELIEEIEAGEITVHEAEKKISETKRTAERKKMVQQAKKIKLSDRWHIYHADMQTWKAPRQYDFIITDPPYPKEYLYLYDVLAQKANEWLKPNSLMIVMCGQSYLDEIICSMRKHVNYYWIGSYLTQNLPTPLRQKQVNTTWKPLLMFSNGNYKGKIFNDVFVSDVESMKTDKDFHRWGQSITGMNSIISMICLPGQYILDPFCGAGTTGIAALQNDCLFDGVELEEENCNIAKARINDSEKTR